MSYPRKTPPLQRTQGWGTQFQPQFKPQTECFQFPCSGFLGRRYVPHSRLLISSKTDPSNPVFDTSREGTGLTFGGGQPSILGLRAECKMLKGRQEFGPASL